MRAIFSPASTTFFIPLLLGFLTLAIAAQGHAGGSRSVKLSGNVYFDSNVNGIRDDGEPGVRDVLVTDGIRVTKTSRSGSYSIKHRHDEARNKVCGGFLRITVPSGYRTTGAFFRRFPCGEKDNGSIDFGLEEDPRSLDTDFSFLIISDSHTRKADGPLREVLPKILKISSPADPRFVVDCGDLAGAFGSAEHLRAYLQIVSHFGLPMHTVPGNHDHGPGYDFSSYRTILGPTYYSRDYGGVHFVYFNSCWPNDSIEEESELRWLEQDLAKCAKNRQIIVIQHHINDESVFRVTSRYGSRVLVVGGHLHRDTTIWTHRSGNRYCGVGSVTGTDSFQTSFRVAHVRDSDKDGIELKLHILH